MKKIIAFILGLLFVSGAGVYAAPGDSAAAFLKIGVGARPAAMGEAYAGVKGDILSVYSNPAGISCLEGYEFSFSHALWFEDISYSNLVAGAPLFNGYMALGLSGLFAGEIAKFDRQGTAVEETYSPSDMAFSISYAKIVRGIPSGASLKLITSEIDGHRAGAVALDLGAMKKFGAVHTGLSVQNIGTQMKFRADADPLPVIVRLGASYPFELSVFNMLAVAETNLSAGGPFKCNAGINADYPAGAFLLSLRLGIKSYAEGLGVLSHFATGFGVEYDNIIFDYALASFEDLGLTHRVSLGYRLR